MRGFVAFLFGCLIILLSFGYMMAIREESTLVLIGGVLGAAIAGLNYHTFVTVVAHQISKSRD